MSKSTKYSKSDDFDEFEAITDRLAQDLRKNIRNLDSFPILSDPWFETAETFGRIANISDMESKLSSAKKDATLWETEEQALRFLLEDGKLNLCLRSLIEFKNKQIETRRNQRGPMMDFLAECDKFEKGLGTVLKNCWHHVEVLQTTDLPALVHHIADVMEATLAMPNIIDDLLAKNDLHQRQEVMVFYYLNGLCRHIEDISEYRIMPLIREKKIFILAVKVLNQLNSRILKPHRMIAAEAISLLSETEDFQTHQEDYYSIDNNDEVDTLLSCRESVLQELSSDFDQRKRIRPLLDVIDRVKRQFRSK